MSKEEEIYKFLVGTHKDGKGLKQTGTQIAKTLEVTHQYIYKIIKRFLKDGLIVKQGKKSCPMFYSATTKSIYRRDATNLTPIDATKSEPSSEFSGQEKPKTVNRRKHAQSKYLVQKARYEIKIEREYINFFDDKKNWLHGNCKHFKYKTKVFDNLSEFQFERVGKSKIIIIVPEMLFTKEELSIAKHTIFSIVYEAVKWFAKEAKIKFKWNTLHLCQKPHICKPAKSSEAIRVARDWSLSIDGKMLDMSSGKADWETVIFDNSVMDAVDALETWDSVAIVRSEMEGFNIRLTDIEEVQPKINNKIDVLIEGMTELKNIINEKKKVKPDEGIDVV